MTTGRRRLVASLVALLLAATAGTAVAHDGDDHDEHDGHGSEPCPVKGMEETWDPETGRKECVVVRAGEGWGSWDPATEDDDPDYSPGDRGQRWGWNVPDESGGDHGHHGHGHEHDPECSVEAQDQLRERTRTSLARFDGADGFRVAGDMGYVMYPIAWKTYHMFNTAMYADEHEIVPEHPESFVYAMTDDGLKAMGIMFTLDADWKDVPQEEWPDFHITTSLGEEVCQMLWHDHQGAEGLATSFDPDHPDQSNPMAHVWGWGYDLFERGMDGTEANAWWAPYRAAPAICSQDDACL